MTKKGFTLIELLTTIIVLAILLAITVPSVRTYISNSYTQSYKLDLKAMEEAAKAYVIDEKIKFEEVERKIVQITTLIEEGLLDPIIDPQNKEQCEGYVIVDRNYRKYTYKAYLRCGTNYESEGYGYTDNIFPEIFISGDNPVTIEVGSTYVDAGATATDNIDGNITSNIVTTVEVNPNEIGTYTVTYSVTDSSGNTATEERMINVIDTTAPSIAFGTNGNSTWAQTRSTTVTVSDAGGVNSSSLKYLWNTSTTEPSEGDFQETFTNGGTISSLAGVTGGYYLWILAKDNQGNTTITKTNVFNLDNTPPVITMNGSSPVNIGAETSYVDAGATASDEHSGVGEVIPTGTVNVNVIGTYYIHYNVTDDAGNAATQVTRTVNVIDSTGPTVAFGTNGNATWAKSRSTTVTVSDAGGVAGSSLRYLWNTSTSTPSEGDFQETFTNGGTINSTAGVTGGYYLWILAKDTQGNRTITKTNVFNLDNTPPVITMNGINPAYGYIGYSYEDADATASDEHSGVGSVTPSGTVNINTLGQYTIAYNVSDNAGNVAEQVTRIVNIINTIHNYASAGVSTLVVPRTGTYEFHVWGAKGNDDRYGTGLSFDAYGGKGGYSTGRKVLNEGDTLSVYVGGEGNGIWGGGNGGGIGLGYGGGGGGATDIRLNGTALNNRIIVAGGGGGGYMYVTNPTTNPSGTAYHGGYGGGTTGGAGSSRNSSYSVTGGTQTSGGSYGGTLGQGGRAGSAVYPGNGVEGGGGGGGYYGGGANGDTTNTSGGGGSSYIGGLTNASTIAGNASMPAPGGGTETGHAGSGYARIRYIGP